MDFAYRGAFETSPAEAYQRLLHDAMVGDQTLFTREDGVEPALEGPGPILTYPAGSWGPAAAEELIAPRRWHLR